MDEKDNQLHITESLNSLLPFKGLLPACFYLFCKWNRHAKGLHLN